MRTRCKFKVVGVEDVEHKIFSKAFKADIPAVEYEALEAQEWTESGNPRSGEKYKSVWTGKYAQNVRLAAQYDSSKSEDVSFAEATPSGELRIYVSNPMVVGNFFPGKNYYLDLIPCE